MSARRVETCELCGSPDLELVLSLGSSPPTCVMAKVGERPASEDHYPLDLLLCHGCSLVQLSVIVDPEVVFPVDYPYSSGNSRALHEDFEDLANQANVWHHGLASDDLVVDIGANDGTLLSKFGCRTVGVEPTGQAQKIEGPSYQAFFNEAIAGEILAEHGPAQVITACNVLAHVKDLESVMRGIELLLADDGILVAENHDLNSIVNGGQWDTVYHEHLRFYDHFSFNLLLEKHGLTTTNWRAIPTHGGSFRMLAAKNPNVRNCSWPDRRVYDFDRLARKAKAARAVLRKDIGHGVWGIGATARATTIINYCGLDVDDIDCVCEVSGSDKIGRYIPGTSIPVVDEALLFEKQPPRALIFSWHMADRIAANLRRGGYENTIAVPLPQLQYLRKSSAYVKKAPMARFG
jgi:hypothetical protein